MLTVEQGAINALDAVTDLAWTNVGLQSRAEAEAVIDEVLIMAGNWHTGGLTLAEVKRTSTPQERFLAARFIRPHPPSLRALFDALVDEQAFRTKHGLFTEEMLPWPLFLQELIGGVMRFRFAIRWPWRRRPKSDGVTEDERRGERGEPVFADSAEERMRIANERDSPKQAESMRRRWGS